MKLRSKNPKFELMPVKVSDAKIIFECEQDKEARKNFMSTPKSVREVENQLKKAIKEMKKKKPEEEHFAIVTNGQVIGKIWIDELKPRFKELKQKYPKKVRVFSQKQKRKFLELC